MAGGMVGMDLRGDVELVRAMNALPVKVEQKVLKKTLRQAINLYRAAGRASAPVRTGRHRKFLRTKTIRRRGRNRHTIGFRVSTGTRAQLGIPPEATGYYPSAVEYGWTDEHGNRHSGQPHLRSAWQSTAPRIQSTTIDGLRKGVEQVATELGRAAA